MKEAKVEDKQQRKPDMNVLETRSDAGLRLIRLQTIKFPRQIRRSFFIHFQTNEKSSLRTFRSTSTVIASFPALVFPLF